jgi:hypothetical protein
MTKDKKESTDLVATIIPAKGEMHTYAYPAATASVVLVNASTSGSGMHLEPKYMEMITETVERSRGLIDGGFKLSLKLPAYLGGGSFELEKEANKETKTTRKVIFKEK